jgi:hypothetical protein
MKRTIAALFMAFTIVLAVSAQAHEGKHSAATTVTGELVDTGCYMAHAGVGAKHASCATMCINKGMPMGVLTHKGVLYLVTMPHDNPDAYNKLKTMGGKNVAITGHVYSKSGMTVIEVDSFKPAA